MEEEKELEKVEEETPEEVEEKNEKEENNKSNKNGLVIFLIIVILALVCGILYLLNNTKEEPKETKEKKETSVDKVELSSEYRLSGNGLENFDLYFLQLDNSNKNKVYSPLSIKYALEMLAEASDGNSKKQLDALIGDYTSKKYTNSKNMSLANAFFVRNSFKDNIKTDYIDLLQNKYNADIIFDSFDSPKSINNWVNNKTLNMIPELVDDVSSNDFFLINALAIDMEWVKKIQAEHEDYVVDFPHEKIKGENFDDSNYYGATVYVSSLDGVDYHMLKFEDYSKKAKSAELAAVANKYDVVKTIGEDNIRKTITKEYAEWLTTEEGKECSSFMTEEFPQDVDKYTNKFIKDLDSTYKHMSSSTDFLFYDDEDVKVFAKDLKEYDGTTLQYVGIMPKKEKLTNFITNANSTKMNEYIKSLKELKLESFEEGYATIIEGYIPMFKAEYELNLVDNLKKLGVTDVFDSEKANLSKMTDEKEYIDPVLHKANIEFSNDGIKASAATAVGGKGSTSCGFEHRYDLPTKKIDITFDRPYLYLVRDKSTGEVWFTGTIYEPIEYTAQDVG